MTFTAKGNATTPERCDSCGTDRIMGGVLIPITNDGTLMDVVLCRKCFNWRTVTITEGTMRRPDRLIANVNECKHPSSRRKDDICEACGLMVIDWMKPTEVEG